MRIFVTGASGWIGSAVTDELLANGHDVVGLARSDASAAALNAKGVAVHRGSLDDPDSLASGADAADAVIHLAFKHDFTDPAGAARTEHAALESMLGTLDGSDRPFLFASGVMTEAVDRPATEDDATPFHGPDSPRGGGENLALPYADRGVRPIALRFAASVHGVGDHGFVATLTDVARQRGFSAYIGDGTNVWPAVHRSDAARLVHLALGSAPAGYRAHAVAEEGITTRDIASAIGDFLGVPTRAITPDDAVEHFGWMATFFGADLPATSQQTQDLLDWTPKERSLLADIAAGAYANRA